jgi:hypothetical protein
MQLMNCGINNLRSIITLNTNIGPNITSNTIVPQYYLSSVTKINPNKKKQNVSFYLQ